MPTNKAPEHFQPFLEACKTACGDDAELSFSWQNDIFYARCGSSTGLYRVERQGTDTLKVLQAFWDALHEPSAKV